ncbi:hypothetical protein P4C99_11020 [Pontiellaceae bacterium B1224]|nr:hypothetical protein [Pontiellaceae bacterium B1224]
MDLGKFKASRTRLLLWVLIPPFLISGIGLTSFALDQQSTWVLERTKALSEILPKVVAAQESVESLLQTFNASEAGRIKTEDELISFLQNAANNADFMVDSLKVERKVAAMSKNVPVLAASIRGSGTIMAVRSFLGDVTARQQLLSETSLQINQGGRSLGEESCRADITFELILFKNGKSGGEVK